ncbi:hypothetical protein [Azospirillum sp. TSO5]|uniref:hypothetical protein n=1 Tax=Azospirillum sp. TSO5 TaxID=716760 RepID=UPI0011B28B77|nr:hypothetical protein [Azospirillum sp. TSO5]
MSSPRDLFDVIDVEAKVNIKSSSTNADERPVSVGHFEVRLINDFEMAATTFSWPHCDGKSTAAQVIDAWLFVACHDLKRASEQSASHGQIELAVGKRCTATVQWPVGGTVGTIKMTLEGPSTVAEAVDAARRKMEMAAGKWSSRWPHWKPQIPQEPWEGEPDWASRLRAMDKEVNKKDG